MINVQTNCRGISAAIWLVLLSLLGADAGATTLQRMSLAQMARAAPLIVRARCVANSVALDTGEIWTFTSFEVEETWRGNAPPQVTVRLLGGRLGAVTSHVAGIPQFRPGEDVVLFLEPTKRGDLSVVSWEQGTFRVRLSSGPGQAYVTQDTASFATFDPATRRFQAAGIRHMPLDAFRARVEAALQSARTRP